MRRNLVALVICIGLGALAYDQFGARRDFIRALFMRGTAQPHARPTLPQGSVHTPLAPVPYTRVLLIDGLTRQRAAQLPHLNELCKNGLDLTVDVGFPTTSLPIQHVLWTGRTQQQSGILHFNRLLDSPPHAGIPGQVQTSWAVAETHYMITRSLGFARVSPPVHIPDDWTLNRWQGWLTPMTARGFANTAKRAFAGSSGLAFVHVLRTDSLAHHLGTGSAAYRAASAWADDLLGELMIARPPGSRVFVLSDHSHRPEGGHGGAESAIRFVRACVAGELPATLHAQSAHKRPTIHLIDLSRAIAQSTGATLQNSGGRTLASALTATPSSGATLPTPRGYFSVSLILVLATLLTGFLHRRTPVALPWWWMVSWISLALFQPEPSLSTVMIYKSWPQTIWLTIIPGLVVLAASVGLTIRKQAWIGPLLSQLAIPVAATVGTFILCGGVSYLLGIPGEPPLMPRWTAYASVNLAATIAGLGVCAAAAAIRPFVAPPAP